MLLGKRIWRLEDGEAVEKCQQSRYMFDQNEELSWSSRASDCLPVWPMVRLFIRLLLLSIPLSILLSTRLTVRLFNCLLFSLSIHLFIRLPICSLFPPSFCSLSWLSVCSAAYRSSYRLSFHHLPICPSSSQSQYEDLIKIIQLEAKLNQSASPPREQQEQLMGISSCTPPPRSHLLPISAVVIALLALAHVWSPKCSRVSLIC